MMGSQGESRRPTGRTCLKHNSEAMGADTAFCILNLLMQRRDFGIPRKLFGKVNVQLCSQIEGHHVDVSSHNTTECKSVFAYQ